MELLYLTKDAVLMIIIASLPAILVSLIVGLIVAIFSATTQIQEQTLSFAPKMLAVYLVLLASGAYLGGTLINFTKNCFSAMSRL